MLENACLFFSYSEIQNTIRWYSGQASGSSLSLGQLSIAAAGAGALTSTLLCVLFPLLRHCDPDIDLRTPVELIKCKMQVQMLTPMSPGQKPPGPLALVNIVVRQHGIRGLWLGHTGTVIRETGGGVAWFGTKEAVVSHLTSRRAMTPEGSLPAPKAWESAVAGAAAGVAYNIALFPADTIKTAAQTAEELRPNAPRSTYFGMARALWAAQGIRGLYAGCGITIARSAPSSALVFVMYDGLKTYFEAQRIQ
jgi:ornithine carrier protein